MPGAGASMLETSRPGTVRPGDEVSTKGDLDVLLADLDLESTGEDEYRGTQTGQTAERTFGGLLMAQAVIAAGRTVDAVAAAKSEARGRPVEAPRLHAVNGHFIRGGDVDADIDYQVTRLRDGASIANRMVEVSQRGDVLCTFLLSYTHDKPGLEHQPEAPEVPDPESLPSLQDVLAGFDSDLARFVNALHPIQFRYANDPAWIQRSTGESLAHNRVWMRPDGPVHADPNVHAALLAYTSDTTLLDSILTTHGLSWGLDRVVAATINHSLWLHRPLAFDDWLLYATESPVAAGTRGMATGRFIRADGQLMASVTQECVVRHFPARQK